MRASGAFGVQSSTFKLLKAAAGAAGQLHAVTSVALYKLYHKKLDLELFYRHGVYSTVVHNNMNVSWDSDETFEKSKKQVVSFANSNGLLSQTYEYMTPESAHLTCLSPGPFAINESETSGTPFQC